MKKENLNSVWGGGRGPEWVCGELGWDDWSGCHCGVGVVWDGFIQPASEASGLAEGQRARFAREAATRFYPPPTPSGAVGHNPKSGSGQFLGRTSLEMRFTRVGVKSKIGHTTRVDAYVCLTLHAGRVKRVKCVKRAILGKIRELHFLGEAPLNSP